MSQDQFDSSITIERCPHDKQNPYTMVSNAMIRDNSISPQCRWLLTYLLSNKDGWTINISQVINYLKPHMGRDSVYKIFKEALEFGYLRKEILKKGNIHQTIKYYLVEFPELKKSFRHPESQDPGIRDPENPHLKNKHPLKNKHKRTITMPAAPVVVLPKKQEEVSEDHSQKINLLMPYNFSVKIFEEFMKFNLEHLSQAIKAYNQQAETKSMSKGALIESIRKGWKPNITKEDIKNEEVKKRNNIELFLNENRKKAAKLSREYPHVHGNTYGFTVSDNLIWIRFPKGSRSISLFDDNCIEELESYIKQNLD